jgi:hypothetical protein
MRIASLLGALTLVATSTAPLAAQVQVVYPGGAWVNPSGENGNGTGSSAITETAPRSGNGSVEMFGDRTRFLMGNPYLTGPQTNLGNLSQVTAFGFDWMVAGGSTNPYNVDYTPAFRLHIIDRGVRSELIWEGAYNGVYGNMTEDTWYTTNGANSNLYQFVTGPGVTRPGGSQLNQSLYAWKSAYSADAYVAALSMGVGSGASANYHAFGDNFVYGINQQNVTYNFEASASVVPEPSTYVLMGSGLLGLAAIARRRRHR